MGTTRKEVSMGAIIFGVIIVALAAVGITYGIKALIIGLTLIMIGLGLKGD